MRVLTEIIGAGILIRLVYFGFVHIAALIENLKPKGGKDESKSD